MRRAAACLATKSSGTGTVLWLTGRCHAVFYGLFTGDGHLIAEILVPNKPHGPQPGRYSLGHTGNMR